MAIFLSKNITLMWNIYTFYGEIDVNKLMSNVLKFYTGHFLIIIMLKPFKEIF